MLLTNADDLLCLQLRTVRSPHTVHASNQRLRLAVPTAAHSTVSIFSLRLNYYLTHPRNKSCAVVLTCAPYEQ
jgi:hypothetical protein